MTGSRHTPMFPAVRTAPVVVVGGDPVALTLALLLDRYGIRSTVVTGPHYGPDPTRAEGPGPRTMEQYRRLGVSAAVRRLGVPADHPADIVWTTRRSCPELARLPLPASLEALRRAAVAPGDDQVPEPGHTADDVRVAVLLMDQARTRPGITVRQGRRVTGLRQDATHVRLSTQAADGGRTEEWTARYAVLAGGGSALAGLLPGVVYERLRPPAPEAAVLARLRLPGHRTPLPAARPARDHRMLGAEGRVRLVALDGAGEFALLAESPAPLPVTAAGVAALVRRAAGHDLPVEVAAHRPALLGEALVAQRFVKGRVLLAGDCAHPGEPHGGFGTDTGVADAADLAWKLAAVLHGWGGARLLAGYTAERRPAALRAVAAAHALGPGPGAIGSNVTETAGLTDLTELAERLRRHARRACAPGVHLGTRYDTSPLIATEPGTEAPGDAWGTYVPSGTPGGRTPHLWLEDWHGIGSSLYDRLGPGFTLLRLGPEPPDGKPLLAAAQAAGMPLTVLDVDGEIARDLYGCDMVLVRPDQHIAWRGSQLPTDPGELVARATGAGGPDPTGRA